MNSIDQLIHDGFGVPQDDAAERDGLALSREALRAVTLQAEMSTSADTGVPAGRRRGRRARRFSAGLRLVPAILSGLVALAIGVGAVVIIHQRPRGSAVTTPAAHGLGASGLIARLAVLRRPQTADDKLPASVVGGWGMIQRREGVGRLIPQLTRSLGMYNGVRLYLVVLTPTGLWPAKDGDQVAILAIPPHGEPATTARPLPALALDDSNIVESVSAFDSDKYASVVSIIPDGVAKVRWTLVPIHGGGPATVRVHIHDNVAWFPGDNVRKVERGFWYDAAGQRIDTVDRLGQAENAALMQRYRKALSVAEKSRVTASSTILNAFAVFSFDSPGGTRLPDGYLISHPALTQLPSGVLGLAERSAQVLHRQVDLRQTRRVQAPSGQTMYVVPGRSTMCLIWIGPWEVNESPALAVGGAGGCDETLTSTLARGNSGSSGGHGSQTDYGVLPTAHPTTTIPIAGNRQRTITPEDGVYILTTRARR